MKEPVLVIVKPDGMTKGLLGSILRKLTHPQLRIVGIRLVRPTRQLTEEHYQGIKGKPFFQETVSYFLGKYHKEKTLLAIIYHGENAITTVRRIAGATNPEEAAPETIRGSYGRITTKGIYENVVHASSNKHEAQREIQLWFEPDQIVIDLFPTKITKSESKKRVWA